MRAFLIMTGGLLLVVAILLFFGLAKNAIQEIESCTIGIVGAVLLGAGAVVDAVEDMRTALVKIHDIERIEQAQRELAKGGR